MKAKKILVPTDFSDYSAAALRHATSLARDTGAMMLIAFVYEHPTYADTGFSGFPTEMDKAELLKELNEVKPSDPNVGYSQHLLEGVPADEIVRLADAENVDVIVMGTHGRRGLTRMLMGSVAEAVVRRANCPVLTIKQPSEEAVQAE